MLSWLFCQLTLVSASVIGIDYGTDWYKVSLIKPGPVIETVLNRESKRKTAAVILLRDGIRYFGSDAVSLGTRYPLTNYPTLKYVVGKEFDDKEAVEYRETWTNNMVKDTKRGVVAFDHGNGTWSVEALIAMQFAHMKKMAESYGGEKVHGAVVTVPPYYGPFERQVILDAAELGGINVLSLMNDETAGIYLKLILVALSFGINKQDSDFKKPQYHLFYDMGAGSTVASLVKFTVVNVTSHGTIRPVLEMETVDFGFDSLLGGRAFDKILQGLLIEKFKSGSGKGLDVEKDTKAMAKFFKEANRVKQILSANTETFASIENVMDGVDFRAKFTRKEFEDSAKALLSRVEGPVTSVLDRSRVTLEDVSSLVLVGGGIRIPAIQSVLSNLVGADKIARNVDGDEAAVFGAVYQAATISAQFRTRRGIKVKDIASHPISIQYKSLDSSPIDVSIFPDKNKLGSKKLVNFAVSSDFTFKIVFSDTKKTLAEVDISGIEEAKLQFKDKKIKNIKVKATVELSESGLVLVPKAYVVFEIAKESQGIIDGVMDFFSASDKDKKEENEEDKPDQEIESEPQKPKKEQKVVKDEKESKKSVMEQVNLKIEVRWKNQIPLTSLEKKDIKEMLKIMDKEDQVRQKREEARNELESFIYASRDITFESKYETFSTLEDRDKLSKALSDASEWMEDHEIDATIVEFTEKLKTLKAIADPIFLRSKEDILRPLAVTEFEALIQKCKTIVEKVKDGLEETGRLRTKFEQFSKLVEYNDNWYTTTSKSQSELNSLQDPVLLSSDLKKRIPLLQNAYETLEKIQDSKLLEARLKKKEEEAKSKADKAAKESVEDDQVKSDGQRDSQDKEEVHQGEPEQDDEVKSEGQRDSQDKEEVHRGEPEHDDNSHADL